MNESEPGDIPSTLRTPRSRFIFAVLFEGRGLGSQIVGGPAGLSVECEEIGVRFGGVIVGETSPSASTAEGCRAALAFRASKSGPHLDFNNARWSYGKGGLHFFSKYSGRWGDGTRSRREGDVSNANMDCR